PVARWALGTARRAEDPAHRDLPRPVPSTDHHGPAWRSCPCPRARANRRPLGAAGHLSDSGQKLAVLAYVNGLPAARTRRHAQAPFRPSRHRPDHVRRDALAVARGCGRGLRRRVRRVFPRRGESCSSLADCTVILGWPPPQRDWESQAHKNGSRKPETPPGRGLAISAGGGTRTPDTRIMIPPDFGLAIGEIRLVGHNVGHNRTSDARRPAWVPALAADRHALDVIAHAETPDPRTDTTPLAARSTARRPSASTTAVARRLAS